MSHANAALTPNHRLRIGRLVVEQGLRSVRPRSCPGLLADREPLGRPLRHPASDPTRTAERLDLHVSTVRYLLRPVEEIAGLDLSDLDERLLAELQVRLRSG